MITKVSVIEYCWDINTTSEISEIWKVLKARHKELQARISRQFNVGDKVEFDSKYGYVIDGVITKVNTKTIQVDTEDDGKWKVGSSLLRLRS